MPSQRLQFLLDALKSLNFENVRVNHRAVAEQLRPLMNRLTAADLEISSIPQFPKQVWFYYPVKETEVFTLAVFALPAGLRLPLHDHPEMTVLCKPLIGRYRQTVMRPGAAREAEEVVVAGGECLLLESGTIHEVEALEDAAFLDLVLPPYSDSEADRKIKYFDRLSGGRFQVCPMPGSNRSIRMNIDY